MAARSLRRSCRASVRLDVEWLAGREGLTIIRLVFPPNLHEIKYGPIVGLATQLSVAEQRWCIAHAIGHHHLHPGNQLWLRANTRLADLAERQAEEFAFHLLVDLTEARQLGLSELWELAEYFGAPEALIKKELHRVHFF